MARNEPSSATLQLKRAFDPARDHLRGVSRVGSVVVVAYEDFLCPYCRQLRPIFARLRRALGDRLVFVFRHFPNERAHPGSELAARASEAAARQGRFFEMYDRLFAREPAIREAELVDVARELGLDVDRFRRDLESDEVRDRVAEDLADGRRNGVTGTPTLFVDGVRYDGAWDYHSMLEGLERPVAARVQRSARVFVSLPASAGLVLLVAAVLAMVCANTAIAPSYERLMNARIAVGPAGGPLSLTVRQWLSEGLLAVFFLLVGLEIRREMTRGALADRRRAALPIVAALGGSLAPALIFLAFNAGPSSSGWSIPTATGVAFTLGILAILGDRVPLGLRAFIAALAIVDDVLSVLTLAIFYPRSFSPRFLIAVLGTLLVLAALNRARVYAAWPYVALSIALWSSLHALGVHASLAGVLLAMCLPTRPAPEAVPLLAQAATALAGLEDAEREALGAGRDAVWLERAPVWEWAARNLSAASARLASPAERIERAVAPWSAYVILPAFAFSAADLSLRVDLSRPYAVRIFAGVVLGRVVGKPLGILAASGAAIAARLAIPPEGVTWRQFVGGACLCGTGFTAALLLADRALPAPDAAVAKLGVLTGSTIAGVLGSLVLRYRAVPRTPAPS